MLQNRGQYATFITILLAGIVLSVASVMVLQFESQNPDANIQSGGDAIWWGIVTLTTVGYGDFFPVTMLGRITGLFVMFAGVGIIGALASILASLLVAPSTPPEPDAAKEAPAADAKVPAAAKADAATAMVPVRELADIRAEIAALRQELASARSPSPD